MSEVKIFSFEEVAKHNTADDLWMVIDGKVYDCTKFLPEHPGGEEVVIDCGGIDASQPFDDIGHSEDARDMLKDLYIGDIDPASLPVTSGDSSSNKAAGSGGSSLPLILTILVALIAAAYFVLNNQQQ
ncbi:Cyb5 protein [Saccharomycopsis crataegensis]|uniref:Cyb5 protein n=1 Tax=Saccharomycopsis crataegensis TaxID=43959 RepID=A0AAV5QLD2_9ASCO|nr:Cyb5 protein [Saccharomycopsis crataegensis]